jgi:hypothetical protein
MWRASLYSRDARYVGNLESGGSGTPVEERFAPSGWTNPLAVDRCSGGKLSSYILPAVMQMAEGRRTPWCGNIYVEPAGSSMMTSPGERNDH